MSQLAVAMKSGSLLHQYQMEWGKYYASVLNLLGSTGVILPLGDPHHGQPNATTFTTVGEEQVTFTWSEAPASFDTALDLTDPDSFQGITPVVTFNATDEEADTPDAAYWSGTADGTGPNEPPFSIGLWVRPASLTGDHMLLNKDTLTTGSAQREWSFTLIGAAPRVYIFDDSASAFIGRSASNVVLDQWVFLVCTKGTGTTNAAAKIYADGVQTDNADNSTGVYTAQENTTALVSLGYRVGSSASELFYDGRIAGGPLAPFFAQTELSADATLRLYQLGRAALGV